MKKMSKKLIERGYEDVLGEEYVQLPRRAKEDLYKRYKAIERATIEYNREGKGKTKRKGV